MNKTSSSAFFNLFKSALLVLAVLCIAPAFGQNTKGDKPIGNQKKVRETKVKSVKKKERATTKDISGRRLRTKNKSSANRANAAIKQPDPYSKRKRVTEDRAAVPRTRIYSRKPGEQERSWQGDISGYTPRKVKPRSAEAARTNVYPQRKYTTRQPTGEQPFKNQGNRTASGKPVVKRIPQQRERAWVGNIRGGPVGTPSRTGSIRNVYPQRNRYSSYVKTKSQKDRPVSNHSQVARAARMRTPATRAGVGGGSALSRSGSFIQRGRKNVYWGKFSKGERAYTRDLAGRPLRTKNFRSGVAGLVGRDTLRYFGRKPGGDASYQGGGKRGTSAGRGEHGWLGDIAGFKLRRITPAGREHVGRSQFPPIRAYPRQNENKGKPFRSAAFLYSSGLRGERTGKRIQPKGPGYSAQLIGKDMNRMKGRPPGGGLDQGEGFSGFIKTKKPLKGGGSVSGKLWNNDNTPIAGRALTPDATRPIGYAGNLKPGKNYHDQGEGFSGFIKTKKPLKGGGSVSGKLWNNDNTPIAGRALTPDAARPIGYAGNLKPGKNYHDQGEGFSGYIKTKRPLKGGGSVSGKLWNNDNTPIAGRALTPDAARPIGYAGNLKVGKHYRDQGEEFMGYIKTKKPEKGGGSVSGKLWNNNETPTPVRTPKGNDAGAGTFTGRNKSKQNYTQSPNAVALATKKQDPGKTVNASAGLQIKVKRDSYEKRDQSASGALPGISPKKAMARSVDFQGNVKMKKFNDKELHPDAKYAHSIHNNVKEERTVLLNVRLFWSKLFHKTESQPDHLKENIKRPRYDKGERGMWAD